MYLALPTNIQKVCGFIALTISVVNIVPTFLKNYRNAGRKWWISYDILETDS